ncbi:cysteine-rich secretory protein 3-like [Antennarius striatus]|uniref:cysteine-rich secretory protein 3-like n=1 Tax=Antennarius striatus TaxID=241820 RepID=UPI0035B3B798
MTTRRPNWTYAIKRMYGEVWDWKYGVGPVRSGAIVGHFTQIVWHNSNQIGCGKANCPNNFLKTFLVCQYCPPGNYNTYHPYEAGTPCADCPDACDGKLCTNY